MLINAVHGLLSFVFGHRYDFPHTHGCLFSGAGGGYLFVISDKPVQGGYKVKVWYQMFCGAVLFSFEKLSLSVAFCIVSVPLYR